MFVATRVNCRSFASLQALEELRRESAEKQATLQEEINRLKREKEEVSNTEEILISDYAGNELNFSVTLVTFQYEQKIQQHREELQLAEKSRDEQQKEAKVRM